MQLKTRQLSGLFGYIGLLGILFAWMFWPRSHPLTLAFDGFSSAVASRSAKKITYAEFELINRSSRTIYYEGTPYPVYFLEFEKNGQWFRDDAETDAENFAPLFPGHRFKFKVVLPASTDKWRVGVHWIRPNSAPLTLRRLFPPRNAILFSERIGGAPVTIAAVARGEQALAGQASAGR